jgi:2-oxoisovalerate dehydrogenase E1 component
MLFVIEDNGIGISTPSWLQTPGGNIAANLSGFQNLRIFDGSGSDPAECWELVAAAVGCVRKERRPALLRVKVPRLCGHSGLDIQSVPPEGAADPLAELRAFAARRELLTQEAWHLHEQAIQKEVRRALDEALADPAPDPRTVRAHVFSAPKPGPVTEERPVAAEGIGPAVTLKEGVRLTLEQELHRNPGLIVLGEDVGKKGGVHGMTAGLQSRFGSARVADTSLSEEGIIGRAVGMALAGLTPVPEIQFRKYLDPATEQINNFGTLRWRTAGEFGAAMVVRIPIGYHARVSDPWHSVSAESVLAHALGWRIAFPSNARDAAGLLREALRGSDPTFFLEHRNLLASGRATAPYPGPEHVVRFGKARLVRPGSRITVVTWGDMLYRVLDAAERIEAGAVEVLDLRTLAPWDRETVIESVCKTGRCLIVHEDGLTAGFGAEIAASVAEGAFLHLEGPVARIAVPDCPIPYQRELMDAVLPSVDGIAARLAELLAY